MRSSPVLPTLAAVLVAIVVLAACGGDDDRGAGRDTTTSTTGGAGGAAGTGDLGAARVELTHVADLERPTALAVRSDDPTLYVTEKVGQVRAVRDDELVRAPVLDLTDLVGATGNEQGLLGMAFSPDGSHLYLDFTDRAGDTNVVELAVAADGTVDRSSLRTLLEIDQPQPNHNGGSLAFGPDGMLYVSSGDGGGAGDAGSGHAEGGNGQSTGTLLGKLLRIDPTPSGERPYTIPAGNPYADGGGRPEIFAIGLRNPWRFSFDRATGDLWIGDVGQDEWEEVDFVPAGSGAGDDFGWNRLEGTHGYRGDAPADAVAPITEYSHSGTGGCSVTGGYVYRGRAVPALTGAYLYTDYCAGELRALTERGGRVDRERDLGVRVPSATAFGEDAAGEVYVLSDTNGLLRIDAA